MRLEPPGWWYGQTIAHRLQALALAPAGWIYGTAVKARFARAKPYRAALPVICIGNFTLGGAGKTPLALAVAELLRSQGLRPAFLTRGYGGRLAGPHHVNAGDDNAADVGDEPLLLARSAPTILARYRPDGARMIERLGADVIIMDDGFQNPSLVKDLSLIAVDGRAGLGNGCVFPAGPLRAPLNFQLSKADALIEIGTNQGNKRDDLTRLGRPVITTGIVPAGDIEWLKAAPIIAFSGIGRPDKFFDMLAALGATLLECHPFPDHHRFSEDEAHKLLAAAEQQKAILVTTEKDWVRIPGSGADALSELKAASHRLPIKLSLDEQARQKLTALLQAKTVPSI